MTSLTYKVNKRNVHSLRLERVCLWIVGIEVIEQIRRSEHSPRINSNYKLPPQILNKLLCDGALVLLTCGVYIIFKRVLFVSTLGKVPTAVKTVGLFFFVPPVECISFTIQNGLYSEGKKAFVQQLIL